jgi:hypothetical protein
MVIKTGDIVVCTRGFFASELPKVGEVFEVLASIGERGDQFLDLAGADRSRVYSALRFEIVAPRRERSEQ